MEKHVYAFHYLSDCSDKIVLQIKRREKKVIDDYVEKERLNKLVKSDNKDLFCIPTMEEMLEKIVVMSWGKMVSVYPMLKTDYQFLNQTWIMKIDQKKSSPTQKYGSLYAIKGVDSLHIFVRQQGENKNIPDIPREFCLMILRREQPGVPGSRSGRRRNRNDQ